MSFPSNLQVASALIYPTRSSTQASQQARSFIRYRLKVDGTVSDTDQRPLIGAIATALADPQHAGPLPPFLGAIDALVPLPSHAPLVQGGLWIAYRIAQELLAAGIGRQICPWVLRTQTIARSSASSAQNRPQPPDHFASTSLSRDALEQMFPPENFCLVDDVVTRGSTAVGCAAHLLQQFPSVPVFLLSLARTETDRDLQTSGEIWEPKLEAISYSGQGWPHRA